MLRERYCQSNFKGRDSRSVSASSPSQVIRITSHSFNDPIHKNADGTWWFWDEVWAFEIGPYSSEHEARKSLDEYVEKYLGGSEKES